MHSLSLRLRITVGLIYLFLLLPLAIIALSSFSGSSRFDLFPAEGWSLRWYRSFFHSSNYLTAMFANSLPVALIAGLLATAIGTLAAVAVIRSPEKLRARFEILTMLPLIVPTVLLGIGLYLLSTILHIKNGFLMLVLGHGLIGIPYVIRIVMAGLEEIDPALEQAARSLGCSPVQAFIMTTVPQIKTSLASAMIFAFIESFSDINLALFIAGSGNTTLPVQIFSDIVWQGDPTIAAASTLQMVLICLLVMLGFKAVGRRNKP
ncbi:MAG TPA: ABC transporter permease [Bordetella sp.]